MSNAVPRIRVPKFPEQQELVVAAMTGGHLATGPHLEQLADALARKFRKRYVTLTANGFSALLAALRATVRAGAAVHTVPASTCFAIVHAIRAAGLEVRYHDMDPETASFAPNWADEVGDRGDALHAVIPDHFGIVPEAFAPRSRDGVIIEDAAQAFLSRAGRETGADVIVLSFYPSKVMNGIDGGAVLTDDPVVNSAVARTVTYADQVVPDGAVRYNLRMNNLNAAFALGTMQHLDTLERGLRSAFARLSRAARGVGLRTLEYGADVPTRLVVATPDGVARDAWVDHLVAEGIEAATELISVCPGEIAGRFPGMQRLVSTTFSLPLHPALTGQELDRIEAAVGRGP